MAGIAVKFAAGSGRADPPANAVKKPDPVLIFQFFDGKADRGLGQMKFIGGAGNAAAAEYGSVNFHMPKCHVVLLQFIRNLLCI